MAQKFGRQAKHLDATSQPSSEETKVAAPKPYLQPSLQVHHQPRSTVDPSTKLRQLQMDNEKYRASIETGHQMLQASIVEPAVKPSY